jgi:ElaB/YqjD/DUF883 family membrane-anchored ribosome-binding protein
MAQSLDEGKDKLIEDFNAVIADAEELLKLLAAAGEEKGEALRASAEQNLEAARAQLEGLRAAAQERTLAASRAAEDYVRAHPLRSVAIVAGIAALIGVVLGLLLNRR